jgi:RNA recognition motif-containing protein
MAVKLFVGGLSFSTTDEGLRGAFARFGAVASAQVVRGPDGRSRGFGFVEMTSAEEAERAISALNGSSLDGRTIRVEKAGAPARPGRRLGAPTRW